MARLLLSTLLVFGIATFAARLPTRDNSICSQWCAANFAHPGGCTSLAARGTGPCYDCGPLNTIPTDLLCNGQCTDTLTDPTNCGSCGNVCGSGTCMSGVCTIACPTGQTLCSGQCVDLTSDGDNCGICGFQCPLFGPERVCEGGLCTL